MTGSRVRSSLNDTEYTKINGGEHNLKEHIRHHVYKEGFNTLVESEDEDEESHTMGSSCCSGRRALCSVIAIILLSITVLALAIALAVIKVKVDIHTREVHSNDEMQCNTEECIIAAGEILAQMNMSSDPCDDFYNYACGNFIEKRFLRPAQTSLTHFYLISEGNSKVVYEELTNKDKTTIFGKPSTALTKVKEIHKLCMDVTTLQRQGHTSLLEAIEQFGSWGITNDNFDAGSWNFTKHLVDLHSYALAPLFSVSVEADEKNSTVNILNLYQHGLTLSSEKSYNLTRDPVQNPLKKEALIKYGVEVARLLGSNESISKPIMEEIYDLESKLAAIYVPSEYIRDPTTSYCKISVGEAQVFFGDHLSLVAFLNEVTNRTDITSDSKLVSSTKPFFDNLKSILDEYLQPDKIRIMNNYLTWYMVHRTIDNLGSDFQFAQLILSNVTDGVNSIDERWKVCTTKVTAMMGRTTGAMFIEGRFNATDRDAVIDIVKGVRGVLLENFPNYDWMDKKTATAAIKKAKAITTRIGYPDYITDAAKIDEYYKGLKVGNNLYDSLMEYRLWGRRVSSAKLDKPTDATEWQMTASEVNAYYHPVHNNVVLPAGILRTPFYDTSLPLAWNYGGMGSIVGHEISHGFDDQGSQYDGDGNLINWWTKYSSDGFSNAKQCFVDQYSKYRVAGTPVNGQLSLGENIADNGGIALAHKAYTKKLKESKAKGIRFPGIDLTDDQLFFLSFAQIWCMKSTPEYDQTSLNYNPHSPNKFRVQGPYSNSEAFNKAFNCPAGAPYNPPNKCKVW